MTHHLHPPNTSHLLIRQPRPIVLIKILNASVYVSLCNVAQHVLLTSLSVDVVWLSLQHLRICVEPKL